MSTPQRASKRGGRRPGAGAPRGNMNALRSGKRSKRVLATKLALRALPQTGGALKAVATAGEDRVVLYAQALHCIADLMMRGLGFGQSKIEASRRPIQLQEFQKMFPTISQSSDLIEILGKQVARALHDARTLRMPDL